ncbi:hypothetical protein GE061_010926, partial [Apolygus lucorum]
MPPNILHSSPLTKSRDSAFKDLEQKPYDSPKCEEPYKPRWVWRNIILFVILHAGGLWGVWRFITFQVSLLTVVYAYIVGWLTVEATMIGVHRFFSHKAFKGTFWFKLLVVLTHTIAGQNSVYIWVRDHRLHHKYSETDADPHNSRRGFFFCHMGWLLQRKHPKVKSMGKNVDMSDLEAEPLVMFQKKYYFPLFLILGVGLPVVLPVLLWSETWLNSFLVVFFGRYMISLHGTWTVNSIAHLYGNRPYTRDIQPVESEFVAWLTSGEGWHNYHHTFPWDYRAGEFGKHSNLSAKIVDWFAQLGLVYDLKFATPEMVRHRVLKRGDGSHPLSLEENECGPNLEEDECPEDDDLYGEHINTGFLLLISGTRNHDTSREAGRQWNHGFQPHGYISCRLLSY